MANLVLANKVDDLSEKVSSHETRISLLEHESTLAAQAPTRAVGASHHIIFGPAGGPRHGPPMRLPVISIFGPASPAARSSSHSPRRARGGALIQQPPMYSGTNLDARRGHSATVRTRSRPSTATSAAARQVTHPLWSFAREGGEQSPAGVPTSAGLPLLESPRAAAAAAFAPAGATCAPTAEALSTESATSSSLEPLEETARGPPGAEGESTSAAGRSESSAAELCCAEAAAACSPGADCLTLASLYSDASDGGASAMAQVDAALASPPSVP